MCYPSEVIEKVKMKNDIVDVISRYMKLQKKDANCFGFYPFHNKKSPSSPVSPDKQMYYCFGYGVEGNVLTFMMEYEDYAFQEVLSHLADRMGVNLPKMECSREARKQAKRKARLLGVNKLAANYFYYRLKAPQGRMEYEYFHDKKDLSDDTAARFGLGYSNKTSGGLCRFLEGKGYEDSLLRDIGLVTLEEHGGRDKFWNCVMFPITDVNSRITGFGGRMVRDGEPKYLDSPETELFDESRNPYSLNYARTSGEGYLLICEGYLGVIFLHQTGFTNAMASLGTAFTSQHANVLKRYTDQVILTCDSDGADIKVILRAIPILKEVGIPIKVLNMKPHKDPDEFIRDLGPKAFKQRIKEAKNSFLSEVDVLGQSYQMDDPEQKTEFYQETARKPLQFGEALERGSYLQTIAKEQMIPADELRGPVDRMGISFGMKAGDHMNHSGQIHHSAPTQEKACFRNDPYQGEDSTRDGRDSPYGEKGTGQAKRPRGPNKGDGIRRSQRLLLI